MAADFDSALSLVRIQPPHPIGGNMSDKKQKPDVKKMTVPQLKNTIKLGSLRSAAAANELKARGEKLD